MCSLADENIKLNVENVKCPRVRVQTLILGFFVDFFLILCEEGTLTRMYRNLYFINIKSFIIK